MSTVSVSSYSIRELLDPIEVSLTLPDGNEFTYSSPGTGELKISEFPARAKADFAVEAIETTSFQLGAGVDDPEIDRFAQQLTISGVRLLNVAVDQGDLLETDSSKRAADIAELERWIDRLAELGTHFVRVNPGSPMSQHHGDVPPAHLVDALQHLGRYANAKGVRLLVENHGGPSSNPAWMLALLDDVGRDNLGLLLDLGNFDAIQGPGMAVFLSGGEVSLQQLLAGVDLDPLYDDIDALASRAELVHVKSHYVADDGTIGAVDLPRALSILRRHNYAGPLTIEYEGTGGDPWQNVRQILEIVNTSFEGDN
ncbi:sugar phosphate isomerase/epimerase family protein [Microbacterium aurum]